jgi:hypothetical protein
LRILQGLKSGPPQETTTTSDLWNSAQRWIASYEARIGYCLLRLVQGGVAPLTSCLLAGFERWIQQVATTGLSADLKDMVEEAEHAITRSASHNVDDLGLLARVEQMQSRFASAVALLDFLREFVARARDPLTIYVTGHSKGGALCSAVALWLAESQGSDAREAERWDSERKAR